MTNGIHTQTEIWSQPAAWGDALAVVRAQSELAPLLAGRYAPSWIFTGCGSHLLPVIGRSRATSRNRRGAAPTQSPPVSCC